MWKKIILDEELELNVLRKIDSIYSEVSDYRLSDISLLEGQSGILLFKAYLSKYKNDQHILEASVEDVKYILNGIEQLPNVFLCNGFTGVLYALEHLNTYEFIEFEEGYLDLSELNFSPNITTANDLDLLHGNSGIILSLLENKKFNTFKGTYKKWIDNIEKIREESETELKWKLYLEQSGGLFRDVYCFGLAHGTPFMILLLLKLIQKTGNEEAKQLLHKAFNFLYNSRHKMPGDFFFPNQMADNYKTGGRLAWCNGDLGCALALYKYGIYTERKDILDFSEKIFLKHAEKKDTTKYKIDDADICHGSVGIAHIYARIYNYTNEEIYREASEYWYKITLEKALFKDGVAGYKHFGGEERGLFNSYGLLDGVSGIGLSLISAVSDIEPNWDKCLLLS
jgi:lantibiotic modifying enzyme